MFFLFWLNLIHSPLYVCSTSWKMLFSLHFLKVSINQPFDNLEYGKEIIVVEKSLEKGLEF